MNPGHSARGRLPARATIVLALLAAAACDGAMTKILDPGPDDDDFRPEAELSFLRPGETAPPLLTTDTSFVATRGESIEVQLFYADGVIGGDGDEPGERFLELELDDESLAAYPTGHPRAGAAFAEGDTVTIRIRVDPATLIVTLEPSGLQFTTDDPAELELRYAETDDDFDGDGEDDDGTEREGEVDLWKQERPGEPWFRVGEIKDADDDSIRAFLTSFSRYAMAI